jgi:hypothetical protein
MTEISPILDPSGSVWAGGGCCHSGRRHHFRPLLGMGSLAQRLDPLASHLPYLLKPGADGGNDLKKSTTYES